MKQVLITGAGGFIGSHLVADQLQRGNQVTAVDIHVASLEPLHAHPDLCIVEGNFADRSLLEPHLRAKDVCFHLASAHLETAVDDRYFWQVNVQDTEDFVKRCHDASVGRFVHCSSVGVFGDLKNPPVDEESPCHPDVGYEKSKLAGELAVRAFADKTGYPVTVIRPAWVYGPRCPRTLRLFRAIKKGRFFFVGNGRTLRHPIYVDDMVRGFETAASHEQAVGQVFIMAGPRPVTLEELVSDIARCLGKPAPRLKVPKAIMWPAAYAAETAFKLIGHNASFTRRSLKFFSGNTAFVTRKAAEILHFKAEIELPDGLDKTYSWISETGRLS